MDRKLYYGEDAREHLLKGVKTLYNAVSTTLGAKGKTVIIEDKMGGGARITKDGVSVAKSITVPNEVERVAVDLVKTVSLKTNELVGDGCQPYWCKIYTPTGYTTMGDVKRGDIISGTGLSKQIVLETFEKGERDIYKVTLLDSKVTYCSADHLWTVITKKGVKKTIPLHDILDKGVKTKKGGYNFYIPNTVVGFEENKDLYVNPYTLGIILKYGVFIGSKLVLRLPEEHKYLLEDISLPKGIVLTISQKSDYMECIFEGKDSESFVQNVFGKNTKELFIPNKYIFNSVENRQILVDVLLKELGDYEGLRYIKFSNKRYYSDVSKLLHSLGYAIVTNDNYKSVSLYDRDIPNKMPILDVKLVGREPVKCIKVSNSDNLYYTDDFILTHNTTSSVVLTNGIIEKGFEAIKNGVDVNLLVQGIKEARKDILEQIKSLSVPIKDDIKRVTNVATVSANNDKFVGSLVADAYSKVKMRGMVTVESSPNPDSYIETMSGLKLDSGLFSTVFLGTEDSTRGYLKYTNPAIIITNFKISTIEPYTQLLQKLFKDGRSVVLICEDIDMNSLQILAQQKISFGRNLCVLKAPSYGKSQADLLEDLAVVTGGKALVQECGFSASDLLEENLGSCETFEAGVEYSCYYNGDGEEEEVNKRIIMLKSVVAEGYEQEVINKRIASMDGGASTIYVGSWSDAERYELRDRVIDAVHAVKSALSEGIVAGGGSTLYNISKKLLNSVNKKAPYYEGYKVLCLAIQDTLKKILSNGGITDLSELENAQKNMGINVLTGEKVNMIKKGIIDPTKVVRVSLENAISVSLTLLSTECVVSNLYAEGEGSEIF